MRTIARPRLSAASSERVGLKPNDCSLPIEWLSGGNQQKVVVGRWLHLNGSVYVFEDPTAGVDVGAKAEIYRLFAALLKQGAGIIMISSYLPEVYELADTLHVFRRGGIVASHGFKGASHEDILGQAISA